MIRRRLWMLASLVSCLASVTFASDEDEGATYTLGTQLQPGFVSFVRDGQAGTLLSQNPWMNGAFVASGGVATNVAVSAKDANNASQKRYSLVSSEVGFGWERNQPDYYLSDVVAAPDNVDWNATKALYDETYAAYEGTGETPAFLFNPDPKNLSIYAVVGGSQKFSWVLQDGTTNTLSYTIASTCSGRPRRIYWTDSPYNAPAVSLEGKFVRIFDNNGVTTVVRGTVTNDIGGVQTVTEDAIVRGVYIDSSSQIMYAVGQPEGQFVIAYYDTGDYNNILCVEVIEACRPEAVAATGTIGEELKPTGIGYDIDGLAALVTAGIDDADDGRGDYLYQHEGNESYSPKHRAVFPLRPTVGQRWKAEIYWMETDPMGVQWPFELNQYENDWPERGHLYVRGDLKGDTGAKIYIPRDYTAELQSYQEPEGHAIQVDGDNVFYTTGEGWSLLKLTADDNVWWVPIHSVSRSDKEYFTLESHDVTVGQKFRLHGGTDSGIAHGAREIVTATDDAPGYIYRGASSGAYNVDLYHETTSATDPSATQTTTDDSLPSVIYAVNETNATIEVWWSRRVQADDMPYWIDIPCLPQVYRPVWPDALEAPTLVIASQKGGAGESLFHQYGAATFEKSNGRLRLVSNKYFPNGEGMLTFWTRPSKDSDPIEGVTNAPTALIQLGTGGDEALVMRIGHEEKLEMLIGTNLVTSVALPKLARPNIWTHVALAITNNASHYELFLNGEPKASGALENADFLGETLTRCVAGRAVEMPEGLVLGDPEEKIVNPPEFNPDPVSWAECTTWEAVKDNLLAGRNVRLKASITQGDDTIKFRDGQKAVLDLCGCTWTGRDGFWVFSTESNTAGAELTIIDSSQSQSGKVIGGKIAGNNGGAMFRVHKNGKLTIYGGTFKEAMADGRNGGCVYVDAGGTFEMNGGTISDCSAPGFKGGAVYNAGSFTMRGGTISDCSALSGAAVYNDGGTFVFAGGTIKDCTATSRGGAVASVGGKATMDYGRITGCTATTGGAIDCSASARFTMNGGIIRANEATEKGGAVMVENAVFTMNAGLIGTNMASQAWGGVCATGESTFTLNGGTIVRNEVNGERSCVGCESKGEIVLNGGAVDVEPIAANVNPSGEGTFIEPVYFGNPALGLYRIALGAQVGRQLAEITMRSKVLTATDVKDARYKILTGSEEALTGYYSFRPGEDLDSVYQTAIGADFRRFNERVSGCDLCRACNTALETPGAPGYHSCVISADETPSVYYQNDATLDGYNPNEEHALVTSGAGGYIAWALRCDLNTAKSSKPGVLIQYEKDGEAKMQFFHVVVTNAAWPALAATCTAARQLPGPQPITLMADPWLAEDHWDADPANPGKPGVAYRDRKGQLWARCAGTLPIYMYYRNQEGFWFPQCDEAGQSQPAVGTAVPWLALLKDANADPLRAEPAVWTWTVNWPDAYNEMKIGQTLYTSSDGLPGVYNMSSASVIYPTTVEESSDIATVTLIDPTVEQSVAFDYNLLNELGLSTNPNGGLNLRKGKYYFNDLPPNLSSRIWVDSTNNKLCLQGKWDEKNAGTSILYLNVLTAYEHEQLKKVVPEAMRNTESAAWNTWCEAVDALGKERVEPNRMTASAHEVKTTYTPRDSYALATLGNTNWVVLIENDAPTTNYTAEVDGVASTVNMGVNAGDAINMHVFRVVPEYYVPKSYNGIVTKEDEQNLLSQRLSILYVESFGGKSDDFIFEWRSASPQADGQVPEDYDDTQIYVPRGSSYGDYDTPHITVGEQGDTLVNMVNKYWICRYRAKEGTSAYATMVDTWSPWCTPPALAEGWVQRVLNNVTPFNQLMTDLYENEAETAVSMLQKAGKPYTGDVALNQDALTDCGLIELYETMFNKAESMSLLLNVKDTDANKQLLLCAERLGDMYTVLGDEAYSDAKNPTIGFGSDAVDYGAASSALFCFDNQVRTLLDEELALLRGRTGESAPIMTTSPYYNRLLWNFTKGITAGEVAYAVNYNIEGTETTALSEEQAARLYPQGHGDAYGHYLSALKGWYRLMRNPNFNWPRAQGEMNIADASVNVDYYEEAKFSEAALKVAKTAADVVDLTARKAYDEDGAEMAGYKDETDDRAFGYGEWANRGAYGALVNWAVANSLLPEDSSIATTGLVNGVETVFHDTALMRIDRGTVDELAEICTQAAAIQSAEDRVDAGLNPLGLDADAIPFDITPIGANDGTMTHYEQIRERAGTAMANAKTVLDRAQEYSNRLRMIQDAASDCEDEIEEEELALTQELIGYYGTPYSDDIGPGKTYEQGYEGPDTIHYMWMDLSKFGLDALDKNTTTVKKWSDADQYVDFSSLLRYYEDSGSPTEIAVTLDLTAYGVVAKPSNITGSRTTQGSIQEKYADFLTAYKDYSSAISSFNDAFDALDAKLGVLESFLALKEAQQAINQVSSVWSLSKAAKAYVSKMREEVNATKLKIDDMEFEIDDLSSDQIVVAGMAVGSNPMAMANLATSFAQKLKAKGSAAKELMAEQESALIDLIDTSISSISSVYGAAISEWELDWDYTEQLRALIEDINSAASSVISKSYVINTTVENYKSEIAKAEMVLEKRTALRKKWVNKIAQYRYNDMFFRQLRNQALSRYTASFDLAQKYVWQAAKAYDYETGLLEDAEGSGASFMDQIICSRSLGSFDSDGNPVVGDVGDTGLAGLLAQMDANWLVLKPRLGINNPQPYATWFSLRGECFRILPGEEGDAAWAKELTKYWTDDITSNADFIRYCQPFQSEFGLKDQEPGLIIPFETTIDFAKNLFGQDLAGGDSSYDSTWYATRIYAAGLWFDGYNSKAEGYKGTELLAKTPVAYLVPMGYDRMRVPGLEDGTILSYNVIDQVIAAPYAIGSQYLNDLSWFPSASGGDLGGADETTRIRKHPSFRAYFDTAGGEPTDDALDCTRLVGRSVWNTRWMLVIPAGAMNADRDKALSVFINGSDVNRDGKLDLLPVSDIKIGFKSYSNSGN